MSRVTLASIFVAMGIIVVGCNRASGPEKPAEHAKAPHQKTSHEADAHGNDGDRYSQAPNLEQTERIIELQAQRAKHDIDEITSEAEDALKRNRNAANQKLQQHARELSERAAELSESAKDRAEDAPEAVDEAVERGLESGLRSVGKKLRPQEKPAEEDSEYDAR